MNFTVALTEDNQLNRNTFLQKIQMLGNMQVVFVVANGQQYLEELKGMPVDKLPQVIFIDLEMPLMDGIETIRLAKSIYPQIHFIVLTVFMMMIKYLML
ncbi:MAG: response regulator [Niastella sp.]|nr:response regulator [Niastella sp.]